MADKRAAAFAGIGAMGLAMFFLLRPRKAVASSSVAPVRPVFVPRILPKGGPPLEGHFWRWNDEPLPLIRLSKIEVPGSDEEPGDFAGVYEDIHPFRLRAVVAMLAPVKGPGNEDYFEVISTNPIGEFGATFK